MNDRLIGIINIENEIRPFQKVLYDELSLICDNIITLDPKKLFTREEKDYNYFSISISDAQRVIDSYDPDWVLVLNDDEIPEQRFRMMKDSLMVNKYVNGWSFPVYYFWNLLTTYRVDGLWNQRGQQVSSLFKWIPEIKYEWDLNSLFPVNQPGPIENSGVCMRELGYVTLGQRLEKYKRFSNLEGVSPIVKEHFDSILREPILSRF